MIKCLVTSALVFLSFLLKAQTTYTFIGDGSWTNASNWSNNLIPPATLPAGSRIFINHIAGGGCLVDIVQRVLRGASFEVAPGGKLYIPGQFRIIINSVNDSIQTFITKDVLAVTKTTASSGGELAGANSLNIQQRGVCWSSNGIPTVNTNKTIDGIGSGSFISNITGLTSGTQYFLRAYAISDTDTSYANEQVFTTLSDDNTGVFIDFRDGKRYPYKHYGSQVWMTKNLNFHQETSQCYNNNDSFCYIYGRLYTWEGAIAAVPPGWHLPTNAEWETLANYFGGTDSAGGELKETGTRHWVSPNVGATNSSGFTALPGGNRTNLGLFQSIGDVGHWWSANEVPEFTDDAYQWYIGGLNVIISFLPNSKDARFSVRCIRD